MCREISEATNSWPNHWSLKVLRYTGQNLWKEEGLGVDLIVQFCGHMPASCYFSSVAFYDMDSSYYILKKHLTFVDTCPVFPSDSGCFSEFPQLSPSFLQAYCFLHKVLALLPLRNGIWALLLAYCSLFFYCFWHELKILSAFILIPDSASFRPLYARPTIQTILFRILSFSPSA